MPKGNRSPRRYTGGRPPAEPPAPPSRDEIAVLIAAVRARLPRQPTQAQTRQMLVALEALLVEDSTE